MAISRISKPKVEAGTVLKEGFLSRNASIFEGWLSEQRGSIEKPRLKKETGEFSKKKNNVKQR